MVVQEQASAELRRQTEATKESYTSRCKSIQLVDTPALLQEMVRASLPCPFETAVARGELFVYVCVREREREEGERQTERQREREGGREREREPAEGRGG